MGKLQKKGEKGIAANYLTRNQAVKKLQISLKDFRRLCILKGVFPRDPKKKHAGKNKTYYHKKDIMFLQYEPLLQKFRELKTFLKKHKKAMSRQEFSRAKELEKNLKPKLSLDHLVRERYPTFVDALRDIDDALCMVHLYAMLPAGTCKFHDGERAAMCVRLSREFQSFVVRTHALRKVFVSIKGVYYQAEIGGQAITWMVPHRFLQQLPNDVDYRVMFTFLEFYETVLKFVHFKLYHDLGLYYPPRIDEVKDNEGLNIGALQLESLADAQLRIQKEKEAKAAQRARLAASQQQHGKLSAAERQRIASLGSVIQQLEKSGAAAASSSSSSSASSSLSSSQDVELTDAAAAAAAASSESGAAAADDETQLFRSLDEADAADQAAEQADDVAHVFDKCVFYLSREVAQDSLEFVLLSAGARAVYRQTLGSELSADVLSTVTHRIVDRAVVGAQLLEHAHVQPQWVYDSFNMRAKLPTAPYAPGVVPPAHLSPFVDDEKEGYLPAQRVTLSQWANKPLPASLAALAAESGAAPSESAGGSADDSSSSSAVAKKAKAAKAAEELSAEEVAERQYARELAAERAGVAFDASKEEADGDDDEDEDDDDEEDVVAAEDDDDDEEDEDEEDSDDAEDEEDVDDEELEDDEEDEEEDEQAAKRLKSVPKSAPAKKLTAAEQEKEFAKVMLSNKKRHLYEKMQYGIRQKSDVAQTLAKKRELLDQRAAEQAKAKAAAPSESSAVVTVVGGKRKAPVEPSSVSSAASKKSAAKAVAAAPSPAPAGNAGKKKGKAGM